MNHELIFLIGACVVLVGHIALITMKAWDLFEARRNKRNGPISFMKFDNIREQAFMLVWVGVMIQMANSSLNNTDAISTQSQNLLSGLIAFCLIDIGNTAFSFYRRRRMAVLVSAYDRQEAARDAERREGGRRSYDPPSPEAGV